MMFFWGLSHITSRGKLLLIVIGFSAGATLHHITELLP
jgi:hypothetical protein